MSYKNVVITRSAKLTVKDQQLVIGMGNDTDATVPLEDIDTLMIEDRSVILSAYLLQAAADAGIAVYVCDDKHIPSAVMLPVSPHSRHFKMLKNQVNISRPLQKRLWQQVVVQKILNEAECLRLAGREGADELSRMAREVQSGDTGHVEGKAAAFYFTKLYYMGFTRGDDNFFNAAMNYGFAIIRGMIARSIVGYGFEPSIGLFHCSELNSFNLADDFIEPYRPLVELFVATHYFDQDEDFEGLTPDIKHELIGIINYNMMMRGGENHIVHDCIDMQVQSYSRCVSESEDCQLLLPELIPLQVHSYE